MPSPIALIPLWANFKIAMIPGLDKRFSEEALDFLQAETGLAVAISLYRTAQGFPIVATPLNSLDLTARYTDAAADLHLGPARQIDAPTLRFTLGVMVCFGFFLTFRGSDCLDSNTLLVCGIANIPTFVQGKPTT